MPGSIPLDEYMVPKDAPINTRRELKNAIASEGREDYQGRAIRLSSVNLKDSVLVSGVGEATFGFTTYDNVTVRSGLNPQTPHLDAKLFANCYTTIYKGLSAVGTAMIFPYPYVIDSATDYSVHAWYDYHDTVTGVSGFPYNICAWYLTIVNNGGTASGDYLIRTVWKYLKYNPSVTSTT